MEEDFGSSDDNSSSSPSSFSKSTNKNKRRKKITEEEEGDCRRSISMVMVMVMELKQFDLPLLSATTASPADSIRLHPHRPYSIGRSPSRSDFLFLDRRVGRRHCQILFDPPLRKLYLLDGEFDSNSNSSLQVRASLNGVFVNGVRIRRGMTVELSAGDEVSLVCPNPRRCSSSIRIGFVIERIAFEEKLQSEIEVQRSQSQSQSQYSQGPVSSQKGNKRVFASKVSDHSAFSKFEDHVSRANCLLRHCKNILLSDDPVSYIRATTVPTCGDSLSKQNGVLFGSGTANGDDNREKSLFDDVGKDCSAFSDGGLKKKISNRGCIGDPPGKGFYLNRLGFMDDSSSCHSTDTSLQELLHPVESISQMFIATFTSDILWYSG